MNREPSGSFEFHNSIIFGNTKTEIQYGKNGIHGKNGVPNNRIAFQKMSSIEKSFSDETSISKYINVCSNRLESLQFDDVFKSSTRRRSADSLDSINGNSSGSLFRQPKNVYQVPIEYDVESFKLPVYYHNSEEQRDLTSSLKINFMFNTLNDNELRSLISAFEPCQFRKGECIIQQGDVGDYFYVLQEGKVSFVVNGKEVGSTSEKGSSFGELALLYNSPRAATVIAVNDTNTLLRVDQRSFRHILRTQATKSTAEKKKLLMGIPFLQSLPEPSIRKLTNKMTPVIFATGDIVIRKGDFGDKFFVIHEGGFLCKDISIGSKNFEDLPLGPGDYFGERSLITSEPRAANVVCTAKGVAFTIDKITFEKILGTMSDVIMKAQDIRVLRGVPLIHKAALNCDQLEALSRYVIEKSYNKGDTIIHQGDVVQGRIFLVRSGGQVLIQSDTNPEDVEVVKGGGYFGEKIAVASLKSKHGFLRAPCTAIAVEDTTCGILTLNECLHIIESVDGELINANLNTTSYHKSSFNDNIKKSQVCKKNIKLENLRKIDILGEGTFGQVWLVADTTNSQSPPYALKVQSKNDLIKEGIAATAVREKEIMAKLHHPFIVKLVNTFQDSFFIYILLESVQGGELFSLLQDSPSHSFPDEYQAKFYALAIADALVYMNLRHYVYRDLKPENVMIDSEGYPILIDFGFAKHVVDKTFTICGTPGYISPECLLQRGYGASADHWGIGILIHEMLTGVNPFFTYAEMDQMDLFKSIINDEYITLPTVRGDAADLLVQLLTKDPALRLGSLSRGPEEILEHPWFDEIDINDLRKRNVRAPWIPDLEHPFDLAFFEDWGRLKDKTTLPQSPIAPKHQEIFQNF